MIFNIFKKVSIFCGVHIFKASGEISHVKGIHMPLGIWVSREGTGGSPNTASILGRDTHITSDMCTGVHISWRYTFHCDSCAPKLETGNEVETLPVTLTLVNTLESCYIAYYLFSELT